MVTIPQLLQEDAAQTSVWLNRYFDTLESSPAVPLLAAMRYSAMNGGKRVRASLVLAAARLASGSDELSAPSAHLAVAGAVEMLHAYSLVHDDLPAMDDAATRRGKPSCHLAFDEATAILAGDALQTQAFSVLSQDGLLADPGRQIQLVSVLAAASGASGMAGGQMLDLLAETTTPDVHQTQTMQELKTGALIKASAMMGVIVGGGNDAMLADVKRFSSHLGLAFQIADDLLDYAGDASVMGKPAGRDAEQGKASFVDLLGLEEARKQADNLIEKACDSLESYGAAGDGLRGLAHFVINRNH
ncbi:MAG: polyprenyl synthetase family protein [Candidatus Puniceispirillaceae bacterium]